MTADTDLHADPLTGAAAPVAGACAGFLAALERLFAVGVLYPAEHTSCVEVTTALQSEIGRLLDGALALTIDAGRDVLVVQGRLAPLTDRRAARLHAILRTIGAFRVEIDAAAAPADLHALARRLLRAKHEADTALAFRQLDFDSLPPTVRLQAREFGRRLGGAEGFALRSDQIRDAAERALEDLQDRGLDSGTRETMRALTEQFLQGIAERLEMNAPMADGARPSFMRSLDEVLDVGIRAVRHALSRALPAGGEIGELRRLFQSAEMALALSPDARSVELMVDILNESAGGRDGDGDTSADGSKSGDEGCALSLAELRGRLDSEEAREPLPPWEPLDKPEQISVLCQLLLRSPGAEALAGAGRRLESCLADPPGPHERRTLAAALSAVLEAAETRVVDGVLPRVLKALRSGGALGDLLSATCRDLAPAGLKAAWPHVVNELLIGLDGPDAAAAPALRQVAASLTEEEMRKALPRLEALEAMRERVCARQLFEAADVGLWPLFALLLGTPLADLIGPSALELARGLPSAWPGAPALPLLREYSPRHRPFLARLLREAGAGASSPELLEAAGRILVDGLRSLPPDRRGDAWLPGAIRALAILPAPGASELLTEIIRRRRLLFLRVWPAPCREAAALALRLRQSLESSADAAPPPPGEAVQP